jgi:hypothetical protein
VDTPRPSPRTNRTRRVPHPVLIGHAAYVHSGARGEGTGGGGQAPCPAAPVAELPPSRVPTSAPGLHVHLSTGTHRGTAGVGVACAGAALLLILLLSYAPARDPRGRLDPL